MTWPNKGYTHRVVSSPGNVGGIRKMIGPYTFERGELKRTMSPKSMSQGFGILAGITVVMMVGAFFFGLLLIWWFIIIVQAIFFPDDEIDNQDPKSSTIDNQDTSSTSGSTPTSGSTGLSWVRSWVDNIELGLVLTGCCYSLVVSCFSRVCGEERTRKIKNSRFYSDERANNRARKIATVQTKMQRTFSKNMSAELAADPVFSLESGTNPGTKAASTLFGGVDGAGTTATQYVPLTTASVSV
eukprot:SAG22_NODE_1812_length_3525_cov_1.386165_2_plen_242_part_00